ncbi:phage baseplate assembly protein V [uncultured Desulfobacter sp.]|uniref:phage baseplate assembly protein V n=1 Tax=uncultured Desulfobacter sp. TaxID=240139 RepID=UPI0029F51761|nr:phage baseplate assembly protein V [uncultured Desulfobacter sp.]
MMFQPSVQNMFDERLPRGYGGSFYGVYSAIVSDINDPDGQGRIKVRLPWSPDGEGSAYEAWARLATMMAGTNRGSWFIPDVDDEVLVAFNAGNPRHPYVIGALWNGQDEPPETMDAGGNNYKKVIRSRNGVKITMDDTDGTESLTVETPGGQRIQLKDGPGTVEIQDSNGNSVKMEPSGMTINASAKLTINSSLIELSAGMVTVNAGMSRFSGVVQADTVITNSLISASQTPCAGSIW